MLDLQQRPRLAIPMTPAEALVEVAAAALALATLAAALALWLGLGEGPDREGGDAGPMFAGIALLDYLLFTSLRRFPHIYNYPWRITLHNARAQYYLARTMLGWLKLEILLLALALLTVADEGAILAASAVVTSLVVITAGSYIWRMYRAR